MEINTSDVLTHQRLPIQSRKQGNKKEGGSDTIRKRRTGNIGAGAP